MRRRRQPKTGPCKEPLPAAALGMREHKERDDEGPPEVQNRFATVATNAFNRKRRERAVKDGLCRGRERGTAGMANTAHAHARATCKLASSTTRHAHAPYLRPVSQMSSLGAPSYRHGRGSRKITCHVPRIRSYAASMSCFGTYVSDRCHWIS
jgi:hypothetical protein